MIRRLSFLPLALVATLSLVLAACASPPAAPALTDPKEIVTKGVTSLADVKTFEFTTTFSGTVKAAQLGTFDLSSVKLTGAVDIANKTAKLSFDAPSVLGTKADVLVVGNAAYYKVAGALAMLTSGSADKYTKVDVPDPSTNPDAAALQDPTQLVAKLSEALAKLPVQPTKAPDEKCGDADCYHVTLAMTKDQLKALDPSAAATGDVTFDLFTRKQDYRPAKISISGTSPELGTVGIVIEIRYDVAVSVAAPPADQVVTAP
ncbi:MAG TPA: hypothetical protein VFI34_09500 [Candidatus Limnocylindrales bacterium]|nr:hypothetical protein [Candidatus Limnocylindrales bacterium]